MTLVKMTEGGHEVKKEPGTVTLSPSRLLLANVATMAAGKRAMRNEIRAVGKIDYAEPNSREISMRFPGRIEHLYITYTGQRVWKGDPVADIYSPEAISAQEEYLLAKDSYDTVRNQTEFISSGAKDLLDQSREKLLRWGFTPAQISSLDSTHNPQTTLTMYSPIAGTVVKKNVDPQEYATAGENLFQVADLSTVWIYADVYEKDMRSVAIGQRMQAAIEAYPGKVFAGKVTFISPTVDPASRTVRVRADFPNPNGELKIEMFANVAIASDLAPTVVVPTSAVLSFGTRQIVWVQKQEGVFEPRNVTVGVSAGGETQILFGLAEGERVVVSGGYLLDSESQMQDGSVSADTNE
jgi:Cu(I)/Ag(I) efflux system membrane fusion protein